MNSRLTPIARQAASAVSTGPTATPAAIESWASSLLYALVVLFGFAFLFPAQASAQAPTINQLKAAWVYNLSDLVKWDKKAFAANDSPFVICVLGDAPMGAMLNIVARRKKAQGRKIVVRRIQAGGDYTACHLLFVSDAVGTVERRNIIAKTNKKPIMIVGEVPGFAEQGACVNLFADQHRHVGFQLNTDAAKRQRLQFHRDLLKIARPVRDAPN